MKQNLIRFFADLRFAIFILLVISLCSVLGTIIEQNESIETYKTKYSIITPIFGILSWNKIIEFGLDHIYKTWWFIGLIILFGFSLTLCSLFQQLPSFKIARRCQFFRLKNQFYSLKMSTALTHFKFNTIIRKIKKRKYSIFQQKNILYCYKGLIGRIAPIIVHFSIILILIGATTGSLFGFNAQEIVPKTEVFHIQNITNTGMLTTVPKTTIRVNDFWINYTLKKTISQFYSDLSVLINTNTVNEISRKTIYVNSPLVYKNIYYYQTDWNITALRFQRLKNKIVEYPLTNVTSQQNKIWLTWIPTDIESKKGILIVIENLEGYVSVYNELGQFLENIEVNEKTNLNKSITFLESLSSTGLQIKTDPGIPVIYIGFFFLIISIVISYITYSQIWVIQKNKTIFIGGNTNRGVLEFELEFFKLVKL